jgi:hypothetical protein
LEAAGSGFNLGFNYSHLEKQDKKYAQTTPLDDGVSYAFYC